MPEDVLVSPLPEEPMENVLARHLAKGAAGNRVCQTSPGDLRRALVEEKPSVPDSCLSGSG